MDEHLFVYGTLLRAVGHPLSRALTRHGALVGEAVYAGRLYDVGGYPGAVPATGSQARVRGELYRLCTPHLLLPMLDRYEGCTERYDPHAEYRRERAPVTTVDGTGVSAWIYLYNRPTAGLPLIATGDYLQPR